MQAKPTYTEIMRSPDPEPRVPVCPRCNIALVATEESDSVSLAGILGVLIFLFGLGMAFVSALVGIAIMILALIIGAVGTGKHLVMVCPGCGKAR